MNAVGEMNEAAAQRAWSTACKLRPQSSEPVTWARLSGGARTYWMAVVAAAWPGDVVPLADYEEALRRVESLEGQISNACVSSRASGRRIRDLTEQNARLVAAGSDLDVLREELHAAQEAGRRDGMALHEAHVKLEQLRAGLQAETEAHVQERKALRAAQQLPDVGPISTIGRDSGYEVDGMVVWASTGEAARKWAARYLAVADRLDAEAAAVDTTPDTSRVTFGARHKGTGMVRIHHADMRNAWWGAHPREGYAYHRSFTSPAHAALAEVREALNTAEAVGVDVHDTYSMCGTSFSGDDSTGFVATWRARRHLAREVQALVDQGLRGDDLNARVPYTVRDHRAPVDEVAATAKWAADQCRARGGCLTHPVEAETTPNDEAAWPMQRILGKDLFDVGLTSVGPDDLDNGQLAERLVALGWSRARQAEEGAA